MDCGDVSTYRFLQYAEVYLEWLLALLVTFGVVSAWRGAWLALDAQLWPTYPLGSTLIGLSFGVLLFLILIVAQPFLAAASGRMKYKRCAWILDFFFSYLGFWSCVSVWRGVWQLWDFLFDHPLLAGPVDMELVESAWISHIVGMAVLLFIGGARSLNAPPMLISSDTTPPLFGASVTAGLRGFKPWLRLLNSPEIQSGSKWHFSVGLPYEQKELHSPKACHSPTSPDPLK